LKPLALEMYMIFDFQGTIARMITIVADLD